MILRLLLNPPSFSFEQPDAQPLPPPAPPLQLPVLQPPQEPPEVEECYPESLRPGLGWSKDAARQTNLGDEIINIFEDPWSVNLARFGKISFIEPFFNTTEKKVFKSAENCSAALATG